MQVLGVNISSYGISGCLVDTEKGRLLGDEKYTLPLEDTTPHKVLAQFYQIVKNEFNWTGPIGCALPAPVNQGIILPGKHINELWVDSNAQQLFSEITDNPVSVINDTDAAGLAEMYFGAGQNQKGLTIVLKIEHDIGSSLFIDGRLIPNTELGRIDIPDANGSEKHHFDNPQTEVENSKKSRVKDVKRIQCILEYYEKIFHPDLFVINGELSEKTNKIFPYIKINTTFKPAYFQDDACIIGAAMNTSDKHYEVFHR